MARIHDAAGMTPKDLAIIGGIATVIYLIWNHGVAEAAKKIGQEAGSAVANVATGIFTGATSSAGDVVGLPSYDQVTNDPYIARWILDSPQGGYLQASFYATPVSIAQASQIPKGAGHPPPPGTKAAALFPAYAVDVGGSGGSFEDDIRNDTAGNGSGSGWGY